MLGPYLGLTRYNETVEKRSRWHGSANEQAGFCHNNEFDLLAGQHIAKDDLSFIGVLYIYYLQFCGDNLQCLLWIQLYVVLVRIVVSVSRSLHFVCVSAASFIVHE